MDLTIESVIAIAGIISAIVSSAAYMNFKAKAKPVMAECAETINLIWNFLKDVSDGDGCDMSQAPILLGKIEKCWGDLAALAPFIKEIMASIPKRK